MFFFELESFLLIYLVSINITEIMRALDVTVEGNLTIIYPEKVLSKEYIFVLVVRTIFFWQRDFNAFTVTSKK